MPSVLVVDDDPVSRNLVARLLEKIPDMRVRHASDGTDALTSVADHVPDLVLTDMKMPNMDGLTLVRRLRREHAQLPVILMTSFGSDEIAGHALRSGAASYVNKSQLARDLRQIVVEVLEVAGAERNHREALVTMRRTESEFCLENDPSLLTPLIGHLLQNLARLNIADESRRLTVGIALQEALSNAMFHGNLEISSDLRRNGCREYFELAERRRQESPYRDRRVIVKVEETWDQATYTIRDEGRGFNPQAVPNPVEERHLERESGRGLFLIRMFTDEVRHNPRGNEITLIVKRANRAAAE
ncbi:MAG TPA: response regulator [Tepidisphaeraceae bacterium]|nr:response regulator [Tepidisphaeraceae bacterium]